ncbi:MAG: DUF3969 family protein [Deltaproteobacteria bacterium]|nr:DUF3969 family protein [Deltaproteobacteria bacterium]
MLQPASLAILQLLDSKTVPDKEVRYLIGWQALVLVELLQRRLVTVRYAEQMLFNLDVVQRLDRRRLRDCVEVVDWGMQLEDWEAHTPEHLTEALSRIGGLAQRLLAPRNRAQAKRKNKKQIRIRPRSAGRQADANR